MRTPFPFARYLVSMLIVALSLQGLAALGMVQCGEASTAPAQYSVHDATDSASDDDCSHATHDKAKPMHAKCQPGTGCCAVAAAPPADPVPLPVQPRTPHRGVAPQAAMTGFIPAALERPPKRA